MTKCILSLILLLILIPESSFAKFAPADSSLPNLFIDCDFCDEDYQRREIDFVNHVRDQGDADIYILVTSQGTASGGRSYRMLFEGQNDFEGIGFTLAHISEQSETDDQRRSGRTHVMKMGVLTYLSQTLYADQFNISFDGEPGTRIRMGQDDPWNNWVFNVFLRTGFEAEKSQDELEFFGSFNVSRVTEDIKFEADLDVDLERDTFEDDEMTIVNSQEEVDGDLSLVKSLTDRWSYGVFSGYRSTTFQNIKSRFNVAPAIEYNIYPWSESDRRQVTMAYFMNLEHVTYFEETIFDKTSETLLAQSVRIGAQFEQPWGEMFVRLLGRQFFHDLDSYRLEFFGFVDVRLARGLSLFVRGDVELIHDQLFLPKGDATLEQILLRQRQLATNFQVSGSAGLRITFGSIYNNVVNERL